MYSPSALRICIRILTVEYFPWIASRLFKFIWILKPIFLHLFSDDDECERDEIGYFSHPTDCDKSIFVAEKRGLFLNTQQNISSISWFMTPDLWLAIKCWLRISYQETIGDSRSAALELTSRYIWSKLLNIMNSWPRASNLKIRMKMNWLKTMF